MKLGKKIIKGKMNNLVMEISHQNLRTGTLINIINPKNKKSIILKNTKRIKYPEFYKILITKPVAEKLDLDTKGSCNNCYMYQAWSNFKNEFLSSDEGRIFTDRISLQSHNIENHL